MPRKLRWRLRQKDDRWLIPNSVAQSPSQCQYPSFYEGSLAEEQDVERHLTTTRTPDIGNHPFPASLRHWVRYLLSSRSATFLSIFSQELTAQIECMISPPILLDILVNTFCERTVELLYKFSKCCGFLPHFPDRGPTQVVRKYQRRYRHPRD